MRRAGLVMLLGLTIVALGFLFVYPARTVLSQKRMLRSTEAELAVLSTENAKLANQSRSLQTNAYIERLAREQYGLVQPGEEAYAILPARTSPAPARMPARTLTQAPVVAHGG